MAKRQKTDAEQAPQSKTKARGGVPPVESRWKPGQSGNPGGLPKGIADVRRQARTYTVEAIERLAFWMRSDNAKASISAAIAIINRGWGMPQQTINATITDVRSLSDAELAEFCIGDSDQGGRSARALEAPKDTGQLN